MVECRPDERSIPESLAQVHRTTDKHELGKEQGLHGRNAPYRVADPRLLQRGALEQHDCPEADLQVKRQSRKFFELAAGLFAQARFARSLFCHSAPLRLFMAIVPYTG